MIENFEHMSTFIKPDFDDEIGEFQRVSKTFGIEDSALLFLAEAGDMVSLNDSLWSELQNSDSFDIEKGDWSQVDTHSISQEKPRDWESLKVSIEAGQKLNAPIVIKIGGMYHLVSGNTRLMVSKALGINPRVWLFEVHDNE